MDTSEDNDDAPVQINTRSVLPLHLWNHVMVHFGEFDLQNAVQATGLTPSWLEYCRLAGVVLPSKALCEYSALTKQPFDYNNIFVYNPFESLLPPVHTWKLPFHGSIAKFEPFSTLNAETKQTVHCVRNLKGDQQGNGTSDTASSALHGFPKWLIMDFGLHLTVILRGAGNADKVFGRVQIYGGISVGSVSTRRITETKPVISKGGPFSDKLDSEKTLEHFEYQITIGPFPSILTGISADLKIEDDETFISEFRFHMPFPDDKTVLEKIKEIKTQKRDAAD